MTEKSTAFYLGSIVGAIVGIYFVVYPIIYFAWNWFIVAIDFPQYQIPGFWVGMVGYLIFNFVKNAIRGIFK